MTNTPWIGVDLDGTLAFFDTWRGVEHIGPPIPRMVAVVHAFLGRGIRVKIFTARASQGDEAIAAIRRWLKDAGLPPDLEITDKKDYHAIEYWDDLAISVESNTGRRIKGASILDIL